MKVRLFGLWQERTPIAARSASENGIEISSDSVGIAVPAKRLERNFQFRAPAARHDCRCGYETEIDALLTQGATDDPHLKRLIERRYLKFVVRKSGFRKRHEQFHHVKHVWMLLRTESFSGVQRGRGHRIAGDQAI